MTRAISKTLPSYLKAIRSSAIVFGVAATSMITPAAFASNMVETKITVEISMTELADAKGVQKTYARLQKKAEKFCKRDMTSLYYLGETVEDCVQDLMQQFVKTSDIAPLKAHHEKVAEVMVTKSR